MRKYAFVKKCIAAGFVSLALMLQASAATKKTLIKKGKEKKKSSLSFEDILIEGKYHVQNETVSTVEADKVLDALLGLRKDFRDRIEQSFINY